LEDDWSGYKKIVGIKPETEDEFKRMVRRVGVRRTMVECFPDIKEPMETVIPVNLNKVQQQMYDDMLDQLRLMDQKGEPLHSPNVLSMLNRLRQICVASPDVVEDYFDYKEDRRIVKVKLIEPSSKLDATMEIIEGLEWDDERKDQVVVFSNFRDPLELLEKRLTRAKIPYLRLLPEMNEKQRYELWHETWPKKEHQVFLSTLAVGSESINLSSANRAIFLDQSWSPAMNKQAIGRVYRPGQTGVVQLIYIRATNTVDYRVLDAVNEKTGWFRQIFSPDEDESDEAVEV
jgi:SNF2 family DNA or RNA helicase